MIEEKELKRRIEETSKIRRWYQKVPYGNTEYPVRTHFEDGKTHHLSYGEGRWFNYLVPILNRNRDDWKNSSFCEIGCSAGLFLLRAWEWFKFKRLIGVEAANGGYAQLLVTKDYYDRMPLETHKLALGLLTKTIADSNAPQVDTDTFPIVDVTLMSCVHYHMEVNYLKNYLKELASKSLYFILLTDENAGGPINATSEFFMDRVVGYDCDWELIDIVKTQPEWLKFQPPCKNITTMLFKSRSLKRLLVDECYIKQMDWHKDKGGQHDGWQEYAQRFYTEVFPYFTKMVLKGCITEDTHKDSLVYKWQREGRCGSTAWDEKTASERTLSYINIIKTMKNHGQEQPIGLQEHLDMVDPWDGWHRIAVAKCLGLKYIYGEERCLDRT